MFRGPKLPKTRYKLVILSNVNRAGFALSNRKLGVDFDAIYTAEDIGAAVAALAEGALPFSTACRIRSVKTQAPSRSRVPSMGWENGAATPT